MASKGSVTFFSNAAAGSSIKQWPGGKGMLIGKATWGGGSVKLQVMSGDGTNWVDVPSSTLSADGALVVDLPLCAIKAVAATGSAFYVDLVHIPQF